MRHTLEPRLHWLIDCLVVSSLQWRTHTLSLSLNRYYTLYTWGCSEFSAVCWVKLDLQTYTCYIIRYDLLDIQANYRNKLHITLWGYRSGPSSNLWQVIDACTPTAIGNLLKDLNNARKLFRSYFVSIFLQFDNFVAIRNTPTELYQSIYSIKWARQT